MIYTIRDMMKKFSVTARTLRFYEEKGLLFPERGSGGSRLYKPADLNRMRVIVKCRSMGLELNTIAQYMTRDGSKAVVPKDVMLNVLEHIAAEEERLSKTRHWAELALQDAGEHPYVLVGHYG